jgi:exodeoxyribonuclease VII small subunit
MAKLDPNSFNKAYEVLRRNADTLKNQKAPDIDSLVPLVEESIGAYNICKARLDAVKKALREHLGEQDAPATEEGSEIPF